MEAMGVPGGLLPLVIFAEIVGGLALAAGLFTRWAALGLAVFSVASAFLFHFQLADQMQFINFFKNIAIAGGFLVLAAHGAGKFSVDGLIAARRAKGGA
ncbi:DoxX family protein [Arenimonas daejeonensis]|uniref:DoxX family protein n=1 Tax=Arenimonas daejeonensis TaxID=370777 RepID=UPI002AD44F3F|nr:DoxX family protein [Arenimonas daejeonensis]